MFESITLQGQSGIFLRLSTSLWDIERTPWSSNWHSTMGDGGICLPTPPDGVLLDKYLMLCTAGAFIRGIVVDRSQEGHSFGVRSYFHYFLD